VIGLQREVLQGDTPMIDPSHTRKHQTRVEVYNSDRHTCKLLFTAIKSFTVFALRLFKPTSAKKVSHYFFESNLQFSY